MTAIVVSKFILPHMPSWPNMGILEYIKAQTLTVDNKKKWEEKMEIATPTVEKPTAPAIQQDAPPVMPATNTTNIVQPRQRDTLFWCVFIAVNGYDEYLKVDYGYGSRELDIKREIGDYLSKHASEIKNANVKITKSMVQEICSELITNINTTSIECLVAMAVYHHLNFILADNTNKIRLEILSDTSSPYYLLYKDSYGKYSIQCDALSEAELEAVYKTTVCLEHHLKPIRQMGAYTIGKLTEMAETLGLISASGENTIKHKKQDLYIMVANKMVWAVETPSRRKV